MEGAHAATGPWPRCPVYTDDSCASGRGVVAAPWRQDLPRLVATVRANATRRVCMYGRDPDVKLPVITYRGKECPQHGTPSLRVENRTWYLKFKEPPMPGVSRYHPKNERRKRPNDLCACHVSHTRYRFSQPRCPLCQLHTAIIHIGALRSWPVKVTSATSNSRSASRRRNDPRLLCDLRTESCWNIFSRIQSSGHKVDEDRYSFG